MAAFDFIRAPAPSATLFNRLGAVLASLYAQVADWRDAQATRIALSGLSDRELDDIGLVRGDIDDVALSGKKRF